MTLHRQKNLALGSAILIGMIMMMMIMVMMMMIIRMMMVIMRMMMMMMIEQRSEVFKTWKIQLIFGL